MAEKDFEKEEDKMFDRKNKKICSYVSMTIVLGSILNQYDEDSIAAGKEN